MSTPIERAETRAERSSDPAMFRAAFHVGAQAGPGEDTDAYLRALINQGDHAAVAGYLEGLASRRQLPTDRHSSKCDCTGCQVKRDCRHYTLRLRSCRKQVAA